MIQRIQTIWLLLAAICMSLTFKFKFAGGTIVDNAQNVGKDITASSHIASLLFVIVFLGLTVFNIVSFKNRNLQIKLTWFSILAALASIFFLYWQTNDLQNITIAITAILPVFALGFTVSALKGIYNDKKKIEELNSNRLR